MISKILWQKERAFCGVFISYSLHLSEGEFILCGEEKSQDKILSSFQSMLPSCGFDSALEFAESLLNSATLPCMMAELIEEYFF